MGCHQTDSQSGHCVKETVRQILNAQRRAVEKDEVTCVTSCERSINDLLSPDRDRRPRHTTIPFMLICKSSCKHFFGSGMIKKRGENKDYFKCVESPVFKVRGFVKGSSNCVKLELLLPLPKRQGSTPINTSSPCSYFATANDGKIYGFKKTGVCITVDLNCFCGISCLDPITPKPA